MPPFSYTGNDPFVKSVLRAYSNAELGRIRAQSALRVILGKVNLPPEVKEVAQAGLSPKSCPLCLKEGVSVSPGGGGASKMACPGCGLDWAGDAGRGASAAAPAGTAIEDSVAGGERKEEGGMEEKEKLSQELRKILTEITAGLTKANEIFDGLEAEIDRAAAKLGIDKKKFQEEEDRE